MSGTFGPFAYPRLTSVERYQIDGLIIEYLSC